MARSVSMATTVSNTLNFAQKRKSWTAPGCHLFTSFCAVHTSQRGSVGRQDHLLCNRFSFGVVVRVLEQTETVALGFAVGKSERLGVFLWPAAAHQITGDVWHRSLVAVQDGFPCKHHVDGAGVHQPGDASLLAHWQSESLIQLHKLTNHKHC